MKTIYQRIALYTLILPAIALAVHCSKSKKGGGGDNPPQPPGGGATNSDVAMWLTKGDQTALLSKQIVALNFSTASNSYATIQVDSTQTFQTIDGFGYALTWGSAQVINDLADNIRTPLLRELFSNDSNAIGVSYLRISIGASDLNPSVYTYDETSSPGVADSLLQNFTLDQDRRYVIPVLKQILAINPAIKILGSPWTAPLWMKTNGAAIGGSLKPQYYASYANYFVKYIQEMKKEGITIDAITTQNEPLYGGNNPSMQMSATEQAGFIRDYLGPAFQAAGITTKIIAYDHNCDRPDYPITVLNDAGARPYVNGSAFHLYGGDISALSQVHNAYPDKNLYFTEMYTSSTASFNGDLVWHLKNLIIGAPRNWSRNVVEWNLASDPSYGPHTNGGCNVCKGALTVSSVVYRNVSYYIIGHASKFVPPGSVRIGSNNISGTLSNVAFLRPDGKKVLIVINETSGPQYFNIKFNNKQVTPFLDGGAAATFIW